MRIRIINLTPGPVSLPGPLPRLKADQDIVTEIPPEEFHIIKDELGELVENKIISKFIEISGSFLGNFELVDSAGEIKYKGTTIAAAGVTTDERAKVSSADTTPDFLEDKLSAGSGITFTKKNPGADEEIEISQTPGAVPSHASSHQDGGSDEVATVTPAANAIPKADGAGKLSSGWIPATSVPSHASTHENGGSDEISVAGLSGTLADPQTPASHASTHEPGNTDSLSTAAPAVIGVATTPQEGTATSFARSDHAHQSNTSPADITKAAAVIGTSGEPARADHKHDVSTAAPTGTVEIGDSGVEGTSTNLARVDHIHPVGTPAAPADVDAAAANAGTSVVPARADHKHDISTASPSASVDAGDAATEGTANSLARSDHQHGVSTAAPGTTSVGTSSTEGTSTNLARADHVHQSNTSPADITKAAAVIGTSGEPARADHKHDVSTAAPSSVGTANAEGSAASLARSDHVHNHGIQTSGSLHAIVSASAAGFQPQSNLAATSDPTVNDDSSQGYEIGSRWINTSSDREWVCANNAVGAAVWVETTASGGGTPQVDYNHTSADPTSVSSTGFVDIISLNVNLNAIGSVWGILSYSGIRTSSVNAEAYFRIVIGGTSFGQDIRQTFAGTNYLSGSCQHSRGTLAAGSINVKAQMRVANASYPADLYRAHLAAISIPD